MASKLIEAPSTSKGCAEVEGARFEIFSAYNTNKLNNGKYIFYKPEALIVRYFCTERPRKEEGVPV